MQALVLVLRVVLAILTPPAPSAAKALHRFAPHEITVDQARAHVWSATIAATRYSVDTDMVLAISYHESRFTPNVVTVGPAGRVACGAMTPYPTTQCSHQPLLMQYLEGTRHWALDWRTAPDVRSEREALLGYAGGYYLIRLCRKDPSWDACQTPDAFEKIRQQIISARREQTHPC